MTIFAGSVAVITGGASGIGRALAETLAARGAKVAIADLSETDALATAAAIGDSARGYKCDVTEADALVDLGQAVLRDFGAVNLVFANAGVAIGGSIADTDPREFSWLFDVNVGGVFATMQAFVPLLKEGAANGGLARFIATGSENSLGVPMTGASSVYTATKHAVLALADTLRRDLRDTSVGVSVFCPGLVDTRLWDARRMRQDRYGGQAAMPADFAERASRAMAANGQKAELTARLVLEGLERGDFMIITDPRIRDFAEARNNEVEQALDLIDARLAGKDVR